MDFKKFFGKTLLGKLGKSFYSKAGQRMCRQCEPFIKRGSKILDLGCGRGQITLALKNYFSAQVFGLDIQDVRVAHFPFRVFDGKNIPVPDNSFDVVFISYVLHHASDPLFLLKEAKRVTGDKIIIFEDLPEGFFSKILCKFHGITFNRFLQNKNQKYHFKTTKEWQEIFDKLDLKTIFKKKFFTKSDWFYPVKKILFVLEKK